MRARTGKIARLPEPIREELNRRLKSGTRAQDLAAWLNQIPEVQTILAELFGGKPVREQNISEWRAGGYQDWLDHSETRIRVLEIAKEHESLNGDQGRNVLDHHTEFVLAVELAEQLETLHKIKSGDRRWNRLRHLCQELARLREAHTHGKAIQLRDLKLAALLSGQLRPSPANSAPQKSFFL
jgi:hypothetical protein